MSTPGMGAREMHGVPGDGSAFAAKVRATSMIPQHHGLPPEYDAILASVVAELGRASAKFPPMRSGHEGWAILLEEIDELNEAMDITWDEVRADDVDAAIAEARQVAAMALRFIRDMQALHASEASE